MNLSTVWLSALNETSLTRLEADHDTLASILVVDELAILPVAIYAPVAPVDHTWVILFDSNQSAHQAEDNLNRAATALVGREVYGPAILAPLAGLHPELMELVPAPDWVAAPHGTTLEIQGRDMAAAIWAHGFDVAADLADLEVAHGAPAGYLGAKYAAWYRASLIRYEWTNDE